MTTNEDFRFSFNRIFLWKSQSALLTKPSKIINFLSAVRRDIKRNLMDDQSTNGRTGAGIDVITDEQKQRPDEITFPDVEVASHAR